MDGLQAHSTRGPGKSSKSSRFADQSLVLRVALSIRLASDGDRDKIRASTLAAAGENAAVRSRPAAFIRLPNSLS